ncbi:hypothetical protein SLE2022_339780 [Rubroshorea leprosula]
MGNKMPMWSVAFICVFIALNGLGLMMIPQVDAKSRVCSYSYLGERQHHDSELVTDSHFDLLAAVVGSYRHSFSGFAAKLTESQAQKLSELPGVVRKGKMGDGVIIGVFDTGIYRGCKAFTDEGLGPIPPRWKGVCQSGNQFNARIHSNKKIIGARWYIDAFLAEYGQKLNTSENQEYLSPRDANGHGTHTFSTAAGSSVGNVSFRGLGPGTARGGAPHARLAVYKVCWNVLGGQCSSADILKAFDDAIHDGVDALSPSIGSSIPLFPQVDERDGIATGSFHAVARGITVVCGAANDGPSAQTVQNTAPWILTVAASTIDRAFPTRITLGNSKSFLGQAMYTGQEIGFSGLIYPEAKGLEPNSAGVCQNISLNTQMVAGKVVLRFTSVSHRVAIISTAATVQEDGGIGLIIAKSPSDALSPCGNDFPCIEVDYKIGTRILFYIRSVRSPIVKLSPSKTLAGKPVSPKVAFFSSRGPSSIAPEVLKPDITAPGVDILAATSPDDWLVDGGYAMRSGTSMPTPHVSGIVALLKVLHPDWSPAAIKSALFTTAWGNDQSDLPIFAEGSPQKLANPLDFGGGIVNPNGVADPGLVYDMGAADYIHYLCAMGYNNSAIGRLTGKPTACPIEKPSILDVNLPSLTITSLRNPTTLTRTVTNVGAPESVYTAIIKPPLWHKGYYFGSLTWTDGIHAVGIPLSVKTEISELSADDS